MVVDDLGAMSPSKSPETLGELGPGSLGWCVGTPKSSGAGPLVRAMMLAFYI